MCEICHKPIVWWGVGFKDGILYLSYYCPCCLRIYMKEYRYARYV